MAPIQSCNENNDITVHYEKSEVLGRGCIKFGWIPNSNYNIIYPKSGANSIQLASISMSNGGQLSNRSNK